MKWFKKIRNWFRKNENENQDRNGVDRSPVPGFSSLPFCSPAADMEGFEGGVEEDSELQEEEVEDIDVIEGTHWREIGNSIFFDCGLVFHKLFVTTYRHLSYAGAKRKLRKFKYPQSCCRQILTYLVQNKHVAPPPASQ
jgi:hypothetical protein